MKNPLVSVVITSYNSGIYLEDCIKSIIEQTYKNWEIIYVDDASEDSTVESMKKCVIQNGLVNRVKMFRHINNHGYGAALYNSIEKCSGEIVAIVDSDDALSSKTAFEIMVSTHLSNPDASLVYSNYEECHDGLKPYRKVYCTSMKPGQSVLGKFTNGIYYGSDVVISHLKTFKKKYYDMTEKVNPLLKKAVDRDIVLKLEEVGKFIHIPNFLYYHRLHGKSISSSYKHKSKEYRDNIMKMKNDMYRSTWKRRQKQKQTQSS